MSHKSSIAILGLALASALSACGEPGPAKAGGMGGLVAAVAEPKTSAPARPAQAPRRDPSEGVGAAASSSPNSGSAVSGKIDKTIRAWDPNGLTDVDDQRKRMETIREQQRCPKPGGGYVVQSLYTPCADN